jgi:hypothetical protein
MNHHQTGMLSKIMAVGFLGLLATMGMLLYTLQLAEQGDGLMAAKPTSISPLAFQSLLRQGEVIECTLEAGRVRGLRRGGGQERIQFQVDGEVSPPSGSIAPDPGAWCQPGRDAAIRAGARADRSRGDVATEVLAWASPRRTSGKLRPGVSFRSSGSCDKDVLFSGENPGPVRVPASPCE